jgi:uncharacterized protein (TIGR02757 family)
METEGIKTRLDDLYRRYNRRRYVHPDPLEFLYRYDDPGDREIAGLVASSLAYGRVMQILKSVESVLEKMAPGPSEFLARATRGSLEKTFAGFTHRFARGEHLAAMLWEAKRIVETFGSLNRCLLSGISPGDGDVIPAMTFLCGELTAGKRSPGHLIPLPGKGSACKRMHLFFRWMVRSDRVDPGGWEGISPSMLVIPLDTHMHRIGIGLGLTGRKSADMRTALEITGGFSKIVPEDPTRYDFSLTRLGIREELEIDDFLEDRQ